MKPRGKPFEKGTDTRRTPGGRTKEQAAFSRSLKHYIVKHGEATVNVTVDGKPKKLKRIEAVVRAVYNEAIKGNLMAVNFIAERVEGKVTLPLEHSGSISYEMVYVNDWRDEANQVANAALWAADDIAVESTLQVGERGTPLAQDNDGVTPLD